MILRKLHLYNVCQFRDVALEFGFGVTGIFGPNGSGKSNLLRMIYASLTGDFRNGDAKKEDNIRHGTDKDDEAYVETQWLMADGSTVTLRRGLRPQAQTLAWGPKTLAKSAEIDAELASLIRLSHAALRRFVFVEQDELCYLVNSDRAERQRLYMSVLGFENMEKLWRRLGDLQRSDEMLATMECATDSLQEEKQHVEEQLASIEQQLLTARSELAHVAQALRQYGSVLEDYHKRMVLEKELGLLGEQCSALDQQLAAQLSEEKKRAEELNRLRAALAGLSVRMGELAPKMRNVSRATLENNKRILETREALARLTVVEPPEPVDYEQQRTAVLSELGKLQAEYADRRQRLDSFLSGGQDECPVCGTPVSEAVYTPERLQQEIDRLGAAIASLQEQRKRLDARIAAHREAERRYADYCAKRAEYERMLARLGEWVEIDEAEFDEYERLQREISDKEKTRGYAESLLRATRERVEQLRRDMEAAVQRRTVLETEIGSLRSCTAEAYNAAQQLRSKYAYVEGQIESLEKARILSMDRLRSVQDALVKSAEHAKIRDNARSWVSVLDTWRNIVHRDELPSKLLRVFLEQQVRKANEFLESFECPFVVAVSDDMSLRVRQGRGRWESARSLSKGQKVMLSICLQLAGRSVLQSPLAILTLDEPTDGLDDKNMDHLASLLENVVRYSKQHNEQLLIVTHDKRIMRVLDAAVVLGGPGQVLQGGGRQEGGREQGAKAVLQGRKRPLIIKK